jgi:FkbM family methyltransferase
MRTGAAATKLLKLARLKIATYFTRSYRHGNHVIELPPGHRLDWYKYSHGHGDEVLADLAKLLVAKYGGFSAIDIGANVGDSAALLAYCDDVSVLCVEGNPGFLPILERNLAKISRTSRVAACYVGSEDATIRGRLVTAHGTAAIESDSSAAAQSIPLRSLASVLIDHPDFARSRLVKIDTDGFDSAIILGSASVLRAMRPIIYFEYAPYGSADIGRQCEAALKTLREAGFEYFHVFDNFGHHLIRLTAAELDHFRALDAYVRSSRSDRRPSVYYFDICALTSDDADLSDALLERYISQ